MSPVTGGARGARPRPRRDLDRQRDPHRARRCRARPLLRPRLRGWHRPDAVAENNEEQQLPGLRRVRAGRRRGSRRHRGQQPSRQHPGRALLPGHRDRGELRHCRRARLDPPLLPLAERRARRVGRADEREPVGARADPGGAGGRLDERDRPRHHPAGLLSPAGLRRRGRRRGGKQRARQLPGVGLEGRGAGARPRRDVGVRDVVCCRARLPASRCPTRRRTWGWSTRWRPRRGTTCRPTR